MGGDRRVRRPLCDGPSGLIKERIPDVQASRVNGLTTTADALWLCTASRGVLSWNGNALVSYRQPGESGGQCSSILADRQDRVWAGFSSGGVALHEHGRVRALTERDGLAPGLVWQIVQGNDDDVWFATSGGVSRYQHGRFTSVTTAHAPITGVVPMLVEDAPGLRVARGALGRRTDALPCGRDGQDPRTSRTTVSPTRSTTRAMDCSPARRCGRTAPPPCATWPGGSGSSAAPA